jgi:hypothetical protein
MAPPKRGDHLSRQSTKQEQAIWETPRKIALLAIAAAAISGGIGGFVGFRLGQNSAPTFPPGTVITIPAAQ